MNAQARAAFGRHGLPRAGLALLCGAVLLPLLLALRPAAPADPSQGASFGSDPELDGWWLACEAGEPEACDRLSELAPAGSDYRRLGRSCGDRLPAGQTGDCAAILAGEAGSRPGSRGPEADAVYAAWLELLVPACEAGDGLACDRLRAGARTGTPEQRLGAGCGGSQPLAPPCGAGSTEDRTPGLFGSDARLDALALTCGGGDARACDRLAAAAGPGSEYALIAATCGGRRFVTVHGGCAD